MRGRALRLGLAVGMLCAIASAFAPVEHARAADPATPIKHFIVLMQENHTFDNYFGTYPGADGIPDGICMPIDPNVEGGDCVAPYHLGTNDVSLDDPDHSNTTSRLQYDDGKMDGFIYALDQKNQDGRLAMGYYDDSDVPYYWNLADEYVLFDRFFSSYAGPSFTNHVFWVAGRGPNPDPKILNLDEYPSIFDELQSAGVSWKFYVQNYEPGLNYRTLYDYPADRAAQVVWNPLLSYDRFIDDPELNSHIVDLNEYFTDLDQGTLPEVAYIAPSGPSEHPPGSLLSGQRFVRSLIQALMRSDLWTDSALMVTYDDWGGWYDHVSPPQVDADGYGFRVPSFLVGGYAKKGFIDSTTLDHTSILKFIEDNWSLAPLASRDAAANSIVGAFDFGSPPREPVFFGMERVAPDQAPQARRWVIYVAYSLAVAVAAGAVLFAVQQTRRRRRDQAIPESDVRGSPV
jgi:phospholipase C